MQWFDNGYANGVDMAKFVRENASKPDSNVAAKATQGDAKNEPNLDVDNITKQTLLRLYQASSTPGATIVQEVVNARLPELIKNLEHLVGDCDQRIRAMMEDICSLAPNIERQNKSYANILDTIRSDLKDVSSVLSYQRALFIRYLRLVLYEHIPWSAKPAMGQCKGSSNALMQSSLPVQGVAITFRGSTSIWWRCSTATSITMLSSK